MLKSLIKDINSIRLLRLVLKKLLFTTCCTNYYLTISTTINFTKCHIYQFYPMIHPNKHKSMSPKIPFTPLMQHLSPHRPQNEWPPRWTQLVFIARVFHIVGSVGIGQNHQTRVALMPSKDKIITHRTNGLYRWKILHTAVPTAE